MTVVDLSASLNRRTMVYPGDPPFIVSWFLTFEDNLVCGSMISLGNHTGTHVDAPLHLLRQGQDIGSMPIDRFVGTAVAIDVPTPAGGQVTRADLEAVEIEKDDIVLICTGWSECIDNPAYYKEAWPGLTPDAVQYLVDRGVKAIGLDTPSLDSQDNIGIGAPGHLIALGAGIPIFESLVHLKEVVGKRFLFVGTPLKLDHCEASPVRAIAVIE